MVVPYAEPFLVGADLAVGSKWKPDSGRARYGRQDPVQLLKNTADSCIRSPCLQKEADALTITVGDAKQKIQVAPTARPELDRDYRPASSCLIICNTVPSRSGRPKWLAFGGQGKSRRPRLRLATRRTKQKPRWEACIWALPRIGLSCLRCRSRNRGVWNCSGEMHLGLSAKEPFRLTIVGSLDDEPPSIACDQTVARASGSEHRHDLLRSSGSR